jgi:hypothetical protein
VPQLTIDGSRLEQVCIEGVSEAYIMCNDALERVLFNRNLVGLEFAAACQSASEAFLKHFAPDLEQGGNKIAEMVILSKGLYYWMHNAYAAVFGKNLEANYIATKRARVEGKSVTIEVPYCDFSVAADSLIVADTIASGATLRAAVDEYLKFHPLRRLLVFTIAGTWVGAQVIGQFCRDHGIALTVVFGLAAFGLASNGFDLSFLHPKTICPDPEYLSRAGRMFDGKPVSAVGWDFGSQAQALDKYRMLCWIEAEYWGLQSSNVFRVKQQPQDLRLVEKERGAYGDRVHLET